MGFGFGREYRGRKVGERTVREARKVEERRIDDACMTVSIRSSLDEGHSARWVSMHVWAA